MQVLKKYDKILSALNISKDKLLNEMAFLLGKQKLSEYSLENDYFEKKYHCTFKIFNKELRNKGGNSEIENDWLSWKFAVEGIEYWQNILS